MGATDKPLAGKRIVVTRAPEQAHELTKALEKMGAEVLLLPTVSFGPSEDWTALDNALQEISEFDWILFTSQNALRFFCRRCHERGIRPEELPSSKLRIGAVGTMTARAAEQIPMRVDYVTKGGTGESFACELRAELAGRRVLLPRSDRADEKLPEALREAGAIVTEVIAYRNTAPEKFDPDVLGRLHRADVDAIVFASPTAFFNLANLFDSSELAKLSEHVDFAAIGPTSASSMREAGVRVGIEAEEYSSAGLAKAIASHYQGKTSS